MIINSSGVNRDTNTMRSDAEIINLIKLNTANMLTRTLLKSMAVNKSISVTENIDIGTFDFDDASMFEYTALVFEFVGTWSMTASSSGSAYCRFELLTDSDDSMTLGYMSADRNTTTTINNIRVELVGVYPDRTTAGYIRTFSSGDMLVVFDGTFSGYLRFSPSNSPANITINGTVNIYGIK